MVNRIAHLLGDDMPRKRDSKPAQLNVEIDPDVIDAARDYADASGMKLKRIVEDALRSYLKRHHWEVGDDE